MAAFGLSYRWVWLGILGLAVFFAFGPDAVAQRSPRVAYVYPAGGRPGSTFHVAMAGQYLDGVSDVVVSGGGIQATVIEHVKPLNGRQINLMRDRLRELQKGLTSAKRGDLKISVRSETNTNVVQQLDRPAVEKEIAEIRMKLANPKNRNRDNPQLAEDVSLRFVLAPDAPPGPRELRLKTAAGLSNPLVFHVGELLEYMEREPNNKTAEAGLLPQLPLVINGRIMPGDVDRFRFRARKGQQVVLVASARALIPYIPDAVPGWFQATLALYDARGNELAYADDYRFNPDPVLHYAIPQDGDYLVEIKDSIYRGREDFVYRITLGELPFVTSIFPLGGPTGAQTKVEIKGWNLPPGGRAMDAKHKTPGTYPLFARTEYPTINPVPFAVDALPERVEQEPNNQPASAQSVAAPIIVNGRIDQPGDWDVFRFEGRAGDAIVAEVQARRLNSPLDAVLKLTDANGQQVAYNDDHEDKAAGLTTHHADSYLAVTLPANGTYYLHLGDAQQKGGTAYAYRLRLSPPQPDFELRVVPSSLNGRPGASIPITVYALRKDGLAHDIVLTLKDAPRGFTLSGGRVPGHTNQARVTLNVPPVPTREPVSLSLEGRATIQGREIVRPVVPAEDMMQAFFYRHLVPAEELKVAVIGRGQPGPFLQGLDRKAGAPSPAQKPKSK